MRDMECFDDIRPYEDQEVNHYINVLLNDGLFRQVLFFIFNDEQKVQQVTEMLTKVKSKQELQEKFMAPLIQDWIINRTTSGVTYSGIENLDKTQSYLFISNHRDIILDSAILNYIVLNAGMNTTEIAIGNNLLIHDWIQHIVKLNGAFVVKRNLPVRELLTASKNLSAYIRKTITQDNMSVWIAQREGRTKDGHDQTQQALLKMLNLSNDGTFVDGFRELKIVPLSISYEREPCGISKVEEIYKKEREGFVKTQEDDLKSMAFGLTRPKGRVHFAFGKPIDAELDKIANCSSPQDTIQQLAEKIDASIYENYKLWPYNYLAADLLEKDSRHTEQIDDACVNKFKELMDDLVNTIGEGDPECQRKLFMQMYAKPVQNAEKVKMAL